MNREEIQSKAGSISNYLGYLILLFGWNTLNHVYTMIVPETSPVAFQVVTWVLKLLAGPVIFAIVYGGMDARQTVQNELERKGFLGNIKTHVLRLIGASALSVLFYYLVVIVLLIISGPKSAQISQGKLFPAILTATSSTLTLFWYCALVVERKLFRSLIHAVKTLLFSPALLIGAVWFAVVMGDSLAFDFQSEQVPLAINLARSAVFAVLKICAVMFILVIYRNKWGALIQRTQADEILLEHSSPKPGEGLAKAGLGFAFFSFIPLLHLVALILGWVSLKRRRRFILKAAIACWTGGFFTILYALLAVGYFTGQAHPHPLPDYSFLADANAETQPYVDLLTLGAVEEVRAQLGDSSSDAPARDWTLDAALALAEYDDYDLDSALKDFYTALQKKPEQGEFYFYYGLALLDNDDAQMAKEQFQAALAHEPALKIAEQYLTLVQNQFKPDVVGSALIYIVILCLLFPAHEYGHAFTAWKLGDNTAKEQGRLTLNPAAHLDLFGSILLPAILLFQQSQFFFGWARPVPVDTRNFKNPVKDDMLVSFAGPAVNLMISMVCALVLVLVMLVTRLLWPETLSLNLVDPFTATSLAGPPFAKGLLFFIIFVKQMFYTSLILGIFNLLPIPPLDGSWILAGLLPERMRGVFDTIRRFGFMLLILLTLTPVLDYILGIPIGVVWLGLRWVASFMGFA